MKRHGNYVRGESRSRLYGKGLTDDDIRAIRALPGRLIDIAEQFNISAPMVHHIKHRRKWKHVPDQVEG